MKQSIKTSGLRATPSPHLHASDSLTKLFLEKLAAIMPLLLVFLVLFPIHALQVLSISLATAIVTEYFSASLFKRKPRLYDGSSLLTAILYALLVPHSMPPALVAAGIFIALFIGKEIFGGQGCYFFNLTLLGLAFLQLNSPESFIHASLFSSDSKVTVWAGSAALFFGAVMLLIRGQVRWELPIIYLAVTILLEKVMQGAQTEIYLRRSFFVAFFLLPDPATLPLTVSARRVYAITAAALTNLVSQFTGAPFPEVFALLTTSLLTPWLDQWMVPKGVRAS